MFQVGDLVELKSIEECEEEYKNNTDKSLDVIFKKILDDQKSYISRYIETLSKELEVSRLNGPFINVRYRESGRAFFIGAYALRFKLIKKNKQFVNYICPKCGAPAYANFNMVECSNCK